MVLNRLSFLIFLIPIVIGIKTTVSKNESAVNNSDNGTHPNARLTEVVNNSVGELSIMTEGGSVGTKQTIATAAKSTTLIKALSAPLDSKDPASIKTEPLLDISTKNTGQSVVGRKGVNFKEVDSAEENKPVNATDHPAKARKVNTTVTNQHSKKNESTTPVHRKKPTMLDFVALQNSGDKTLPLIEEGLKHKQATSPGSHPGMIMPIVITVLVVPMFAVLGYMALKRGQEAWKNRHYKRMDFLLDGMYND